MKDPLTLSKYMYETIAIGAGNQLPISSVCDAKCIFCSNNMNPFKIYREGFRSLEDIKKGIALLNINDSSEIRIGDSLPGRISEGEALLHPEIFTILQMIRKKIPNRVIQVNTNGAMLTKEFIQKLEQFKPMNFTISYHSDKEEYWCKIFNLNKDKYTIARNCFFQLNMKGFGIQATMVPLPDMLGYDDIENTIKNLRCYTDNIIMYPPGFSKMASIELQKLLRYDSKELSFFLSDMRKKYKININNFSDPFKPLLFNPYNLMINSFNKKHKKVLWLLSEAAYIQAGKIINSYLPFVPNNHYAVKTKNKTYGGNINVAGLLMVDDFDSIIKNTLKRYLTKDVKIDLLILPKIAFDRYGDDLTGKNYSVLEDKYKLPVWLG